jgi:hypothetical protein
MNATVKASTRETLERVLSYRNDAVAALYEREYSMSPLDATQLTRDVALLLALEGYFDLKPSPGEPLDRAWEKLIVATPLYRTLCSELFGRYIDHQEFPKDSVALSDLANTYNSAAALLRMAGEVPSSNWDYWSQPRSCHCKAVSGPPLA